jgi:UDP-N-acetylmuramoylalanine--D-glutamate ligase
VTNLSPNHLDRHATYSDYAAAKKEILRPAAGPSTAVFERRGPRVRSWAPGGSGMPVPADDLLRPHGARRPGCRRSLDLGGRHRGVPSGSGAGGSTSSPPPTWLFRAASTCSTRQRPRRPPGAWAWRPAKIADAVRAFRAVEHRLEPAAACDGVQYLNDSIATTPESTIAALEALGPKRHRHLRRLEKRVLFPRAGESHPPQGAGGGPPRPDGSEIRASIPRCPEGRDSSRR